MNTSSSGTEETEVKSSLTQTNPCQVTIPADCQGVVSAITHATYGQKLEVKLDDLSTTFIGTGENVSMYQMNKSPSWSFTPLSSERTMQLTFSFNAGQGYDLAIVNTPVVVENGPFTTITIVSEDATDNDDNDTIATIVCFSTHR